MFFQFGTIVNPYGTLGSTHLAGAGNEGQGLFLILNALVKLIVVVAGLYAFLNLILAGYGFMSAGGDSKAVGKAWEKIWLSLTGLLIVAGSFILAMIFGYILFGNTSALINPRIYTP